jgi:hypothetical protein
VSEPNPSSAVPAHRDDAELDAVAEPVHEGHGAAQHGRGDVGEREPDLVDSRHAEDGPERCAQHLPPAGGAQRECRCGFVTVVPRDRGSRLLEQQLQRAGPQLLLVL